MYWQACSQSGVVDVETATACISTHQFSLALRISLSVGATLKSPPQMTGFLASSSRRYRSNATFHSFLYSMFWGRSIAVS